MPRNGSETVTVTVRRECWESLLDSWEEAMEARFAEAWEWWGGRADEVVWPVHFEHLKELARNGELAEMDPRAIVDNFLVNGEMVVRSEFREGGEWEYYWKKYDGDWERLCEDALDHADDPENGDSYAIMRY